MAPNQARQRTDRTDDSSPIELLKVFAAEFDTRFEKLLQPADAVPQELLEAVRYTALAPGKRLRPYLVSRCCELSGGHRDDAWHVGAAVECIHAFSLIHDDLPAMDNDDLRRGLPTCHVKFGEAIAILAGDALSILAFDLLTDPSRDQATAARMVRVLATGAGWSGMIGGQTADVLGESQPPSLELAQYVHQRKTACLFEIACRLGVLAGQGSQELQDILGGFGQLLGKAFQITDDLLDMTSTSQALGKRVKKDANANKQTFPQCVGIERSIETVRELTDQATTAIEGLRPDGDDLRELVRNLAYRNY